MKKKIDIKDKQYRVMSVEVKSIDKASGTLEAIFSTEKEDRHGDVVIQDGWDLKNFKKNPVILNSHNYGDAAEVIGKASNVRVENGKLQGVITFAVNENPKAKVIFDLYAGGFLNAFSVGFIVKKFATDDKGITDYYTIAESELLEVSAVSVPANAYALAKSKGIDVEALGDAVDDKDEETDEDEDDETDDDTDEDESDEKSCEECARRAEEEANKEDEKIEEPVPQQEEVKKESYQSKVLKVINEMTEQQKQSLSRAAKIIKSILDNDIEGKNLEEDIKNQVRKRKLNQAIREIMKSR